MRYQDLLSTTLQVNQLRRHIPQIMRQKTSPPGACLRRGRTGGLLCSILSLLLNTAKRFHCLLGIRLTRQFSGCVKGLQHLVLGLLGSAAGSGYVSIAYGSFRGDREMRTSAAGAGFASAMSYFGLHGVQTPSPYCLL